MVILNPNHNFRIKKLHVRQFLVQIMFLKYNLYQVNFLIIYGWMIAINLFNLVYFFRYIP